MISSLESDRHRASEPLDASEAKHQEPLRVMSSPEAIDDASERKHDDQDTVVENQRGSRTWAAMSASAATPLHWIATQHRYRAGSSDF